MARALTVSIVTYNGAEKIVRCLQSLHEQSFEDFDVIVVDNASTDGTVAAVTNAAPEAKIVALHHNTGFGAGHNVAIRLSVSPFILVLNQDVVLHKDALAALMSAAQKHDEAAALGPCLFRGTGPTENEKIDTAGIRKAFPYRFSDRATGEAFSERYQRSGFVFGVSGSCVLLRRSALETIAMNQDDGTTQYFDESFFMYKEDIDLCLRLARQGWKSWYEAAATGWHTRTGHAPKNTTSTPQHRRTLPAYVREYSYRNHWFLIVKHAPLLLLPFVSVYELVKFLFLLFTEPRTLGMIPQVFSSLPRLLRQRYAPNS